MNFDISCHELYNKYYRKGTKNVIQHDLIGLTTSDIQVLSHQVFTKKVSTAKKC